MNEELIKRFIKRLDLIVSLNMNPLSANTTDQEKIQRLDSFGLTPADIASILGSTSDKVSKQLYVIRNRSKVKK